MFSYAALKYVFAKRVLILSLKCIRLLLIFVLHVPRRRRSFFLYVQLPPSQPATHSHCTARYNVASEWVENLELSDVEKTSKKSVFSDADYQQPNNNSAHKVLPCCCDCRELALCWLVAHCNFDWPFFCKQAHTTSEVHTHCRWHFSYSLTVRAMTWKVDQSHVTLSCRQKKNIFTSVSRKKRAVNCFSNLFILISDVVGRALKWNENDRARDVDGGREASKKVKMITDLDSSHSFTLNSAAARCFLPLTSFVLFCENVWITSLARFGSREGWMDEKIITFFTAMMMGEKENKTSKKSHKSTAFRLYNEIDVLSITSVLNLSPAFVWFSH